MSTLTRRPPGKRLLSLTALFAALFLRVVPVRAQQEEQEAMWNDPRALELVERARVERHSAVVDTAFRSYRADARGYVYFFFDRPETKQRNLVKADQIALEVFWQAPGKTRQRIVGLRDKKLLPTNIHYHLDHLTVVQDDFGDRIRVGDGDEVSEVVHPLAPDAEAVYDYLLADSMTLSYGSGSEVVRVYELRVRPKNPDVPGYVGSVFLDRKNGAIVRMSFTFTPSSYVDPYLDYIRISLDNSLWMKRYWLPYRQEVELRREIPQLDFLAGSIIRGRFEIGPYVFNLPLPPSLFAGRSVTAVPEAERRSFPFERGLFDDLDREGLAPTPSLEEVRAQARRMLAGKALSGLSPVRFQIRSVSDVLRYDRAEGLYVGGGVNLRPDADLTARLGVGYAFGRQRPSASIELSPAAARFTPVLEAWWDRLCDLGPFEGTSPVVSTLGAALTGRDWLDPWFSRGARVTLRGPQPGEGPSVAIRWERHRSAHVVVAGHEFAPVRPIEEGDLAAVDARLRFDVPLGGEGTVDVTGGHITERSFGSVVIHDTWTDDDQPDRSWKLRADLAVGGATARAPVQELFFLGGRGTLPGWGYRSFVGRGFWLARVEGSHPLLQPWVGIRAFAALGATTFASASLPAGGEDAHDSDGPRASVGVGLSLGWDVLRVDFAHGVGDGGRWEMIFSVDPRFRPWL